ncbi:MAG: FecR domain-containing protein [Tannerellaceae bacterium]|jgi:ferric-dicitrate binding protein FerR (iron transport regulator)|nr:FecR domain-containing protein [Tannerellaceae bacterium]
MDKEILYRFFEGTTSAAEEEAIRQWMETSPENTASFFRESRFHDSLVLLEQDGRKDNKVHKTNRFRRIVIEYSRIAAAVLLTLALTYWLTMEREDASSMYTLTVPAGQRANISLPDGTNLWLNARTTLRYASSFNRKERRVFLDGEAYFDVSPNAKKRFIVDTEMGEVEVTGTGFNVEAYTGSGMFETSLLKGRVDVKIKDIPDQTTRLMPDQKALWKDGKMTVEAITDYSKFSWRDGLISFREMSFADLMKEIEKCYGMKIVLNNKQAAEHILSGKFRHTDGIDYILRVLQRDVRFSYSRDDENNSYQIE